MTAVCDGPPNELAAISGCVPPPAPALLGASRVEHVRELDVIVGAEDAIFVGAEEFIGFQFDRK